LGEGRIGDSHDSLSRVGAGEKSGLARDGNNLHGGAEAAKGEAQGISNCSSEAARAVPEGDRIASEGARVFRANTIAVGAGGGRDSKVAASRIDDEVEGLSANHDGGGAVAAVRSQEGNVADKIASRFTRRRCRRYLRPSSRGACVESSSSGSLCNCGGSGSMSCGRGCCGMKSSSSGGGHGGSGRGRGLSNSGRGRGLGSSGRGGAGYNNKEKMVAKDSEGNFGKRAK